MYVTDGGLETDLIFHYGIDLPFFASFPLLASPEGRASLEKYFDGYAAIAAGTGYGLMLESATWRANPDWGTRLGYSAQALTQANIDGIELLQQLRGRYAASVEDIVVSGAIGPRGDGYQANLRMQPQEAADYHSAQVDAFAKAGADMVTAYTMTHAGEAIGIVQAARAAGLPVAISFTVETDGSLPDGTTLAQAIGEADATAAPDHFLVNCAHPSHIERALADAGPWRERIKGLRPNASLKSHAELDEAEELDEGHFDELTGAYQRVSALLPELSIVGGCCGTDARHVARLAGARA
jgi:S-methylmethionine-dependent homocysteine/selenocysteine methylase